MAFRPAPLGPGAVLFRGHEAAFRRYPDLITVAEIEPQTFWTKGTSAGAAARGASPELESIAALPQRKLVHGVGAPLGGTVCDQDRHIDEFRRWSRGLGAAWTSEHLSLIDLSGARGVRSCGFLMPPLQTEPSAELAARNIARRREVLAAPLAFETGVNYFPRRSFEMPDGDFFAAVAELSDCGILLDLNNLWVNEKNGRALAKDVLKALPLDRVWEVHLAGAVFEQGYWLDAHSGGCAPDLFGLAEDLIPQLSSLGAVVFEVAPAWYPHFGEAAFLREMERINRLWEIPRPAARTPAPKPAVVQVRDSSSAPAPAAWEQRLARRLLPVADRPHGEDDPRFDGSDERAFALYADLIASFRRGAIIDVLPNTVRFLLLATGEACLRERLDRFFSTLAPSLHPSDEALAFRRFLEVEPAPAPGLRDVLTFEAALIEAASDDRIVRIEVSSAIDGMLAEIAAGRLPTSAPERRTRLEIGLSPRPFVREVAADEV